MEVVCVESVDILVFHSKPYFCVVRIFLLNQTIFFPASRNSWQAFNLHSTKYTPFFCKSPFLNIPSQREHRNERFIIRDGK